MADIVQRDELGGFLRSRREATDPVSVGLEPGPRRRTPGLRREELALLAGLSVTWYTWLEQGRDIAVSRQVVNSLARALRLPATDRAHLFTLAGLALPAQSSDSHAVDPLLARLVHEFLPKPAYVMNQWWDLLAYNEMYADFLGGLDHRPPAERNIMWITFTETRGTGIFVDWAAEAGSLVGQFRSHMARFPDDPRGKELLHVLLDADPKFAELWDQHLVSGFSSSRKKLLHPQIGRLELDYVKLGVGEDDQLALIVFLPADPETATKLADFRP
jgi:transcriptional regulator with XRE-family HTH domain